MSCDRFNPCPDPKVETARNIASDLDRHNTESAAQTMREASYGMSARDFRETIGMARNMERRGVGDDLYINQQGLLIIDTGRQQLTVATRDYDQRMAAARQNDRYGHHPQDGRHPQNNYPQDRLPQGRQQNGVNDVVINGVVGAAAGAAVDGRKGAIAGGAGAVAGKVIDNMGGGTGSVVGDTVVKGVVGAVIGGAIDGNKGAKAGAAGSVAGSVLDIFRNRENPNNL